MDEEALKIHKRKNRLYHGLFLIGGILLHLIFLVVLFYTWKPIAEWYVNKFPIRGIDFYNTVTYVRYLRDHTALRFTGWKDLWFSGYPLATDYPGLHFYLMLPLVGYFGLVQTVQYYMLATLFLYGTFSYLLFYQISKLRSLSLVLAAAVLWSVGPYGALIWGGSLPFFATQMFYPLAVYLCVRYLTSSNKRWFYASILATGIAIFGHPLVPVIYIVPTVAILLAFWNDKKTKIVSVDKLKDFILFVVGVFTVGFADVRYLLADVMKFVLGRFGSLVQLVFGRFVTVTYNDELNVASQGSTAEAEFAKNQLSSIITQTNGTIFVLGLTGALLLLVTMFIRKKKLGVLTVLPGLLLSAYLVFYIALYAYGIPFFHGGWYRTFWAVPVVFGLLVAWLVGQSVDVISTKLKSRFSNNLALVLSVSLSVQAVILVGGLLLLKANSSQVIDQIDSKSIASSAFPDRLNILTSDKEIEEISKTLVPDWLEANNRNYRLYEIDATVNIWWNTLYKMPLARGYIDPPLSTDERWGLFWLDSVMGVGANSNRSSLEIDWEVPTEVVDNNTLFLLDWYAVRYLEGNHYSTGNSLFAQHVTSDAFTNKMEERKVNGILQRYETASGKEEWNEKGEQSLRYFRIKNNLTSPVVSASRAPLLLLIGSDSAYDTMMRFFGMANFNSQFVVLVKGPQFIDDVNLADLTGYDGVILYDYDYRKHGKSWAAIEGFVKNGGSVFIDTGVEVKESDSINLPSGFPRELPSVFPIVKTVREDLGSEWKVKTTESDLTKNIAFNEFSPLVFDEKPWNVSHPKEPSDVKEKAEMLVYLHDFPVVVKTDELGGKVLWSGLNLPYHVIREYNSHEAEFLKRIFNELFKVGERYNRPSSRVRWTSPQDISIETEGAKGIIVKQQAFSGWKAQVVNEDRTLKQSILLVGPTTPGFMYIRTPENGSTRVRLRYSGDPAVKRIILISGVVIAYLLDAIFFDKKILFRATYYLKGLAIKFLRKWWVRDEE